MTALLDKQMHPAWMLAAGTALWLLEIAVNIYWHLVKSDPLAIPEWQSWTFIIVLHALTATWFGLMWPKVIRWRRRKSQRLLPEVRAERERIAQDLHDGVGSQLINAIALLDMPQPDLESVKLAVGHAMLTLRTEMEALDDADASLVERLSSLRWRMQPLLESRGMKMLWKMPVSDIDKSPRSQVGAQLSLLVQEAVSNAIQHSRGKNICVELDEKLGRDWILEISDDGAGFASKSTSTPDFMSRRGWGLEGMRSRAHQVGAHFSCNTSAQGTRIRITWKGKLS